MKTDSQMGQVGEHMQFTNALHEETMRAATPEARQILMDKQWEEMQSCMDMMNKMRGGEMMCGAFRAGMKPVARRRETIAQNQ